jgi:hypothetical protein
MSYNSKYKGVEVDDLLDKINDFNPDDKVNKAGDIMTGSLTAACFLTGNRENGYFQCQKFRGEGGPDEYFHAIDFGYSAHDQVDFYEYGGLWNFWKNQTVDGSGKVLAGKISFPEGWVGNVVGNVTGNADSATKARQDSEGNDIHNTYSKKISVVDHGTEETTFTLTPNTLHIWGEVASLSLDFGESVDGSLSEYMFRFSSGATPTTLTLPDSVSWANGMDVSIQSGKTYEVAIIDGYGCILGFETIIGV